MPTAAAATCVLTRNSAQSFVRTRSVPISILGFARPAIAPSLLECSKERVSKIGRCVQTALWLRIFRAYSFAPGLATEAEKFGPQVVRCPLHCRRSINVESMQAIRNISRGFTQVNADQEGISRLFYLLFLIRVCLRSSAANVSSESPPPPREHAGEKCQVQE